LHRAPTIEDLLPQGEQNQPDKLSCLSALWLTRRGQHTSTLIPRSSATAATVESVIVLYFVHWSAAVFGRSSTASKGVPPKAVERIVTTKAPLDAGARLFLPSGAE
jgi:hypothetical protein